MKLIIDKDKKIWVGQSQIVANFQALPFDDGIFDEVVVDPSQEKLWLDTQIAKELYRVSKR